MPLTTSYDYDSANRLISISGGQSATYAYNGLGDRLSQNGVNYTLDLNAGLTQVLSDGTNTYLYGVDRIAQVNTTTEYFLGDALGSVRQLTDAQGEITLANAYEPYGSLAQTVGNTQTSYGFTGEFTDSSGMVYLRARYYIPNNGRFLTKDTFGGVLEIPASLNRFNYVHGNPVMYTDPSGQVCVPCIIALLIVLGVFTQGCSSPPDAVLPTDTQPNLIFRLTTTDWEGQNLVLFDESQGYEWNDLSKQAALLSLDLIQRASNKSPQQIIDWLRGRNGESLFRFVAREGQSVGGNYESGAVFINGASTPSVMSVAGIHLLLHELAHGFDETEGMWRGYDTGFSSHFDNNGVGWIPEYTKDANNVIYYTGSRNGTNGPADDYGARLGLPVEDFASSFASVVIEENT